MDQQDAFGDLLAELPLGVVELTAAGEVTWANPNARLLMSGPLSGPVSEVLGRLARAAWSQRGLVEHTLALGSLGEVRVWASPSRGGGGVTVMLERSAMARSRLESTLMSMLVQSSTGAETWRACAQRALETLCASLPGAHAVVYQVHGSRLEPAADAGLGVVLKAALRELDIHPAELIGRCATSPRTIAVTDAAASALVLPFAYGDRKGLAAIAAPLCGPTREVRGVLYVCGPQVVLQESEARLLLKLSEMLTLLLEQKDRDETVARERDRFASLLENLPDAVLEVPRSGQVTLAGGATQSVLGFTPRQLEGLSWSSLISEADRARITEAISAARGPTAPVEVTTRTGDGERRALQVTAHSTSDDVTRLVLRDVTQVNRLRAEAHAAMDAAQRNERLAILGRLTAGVAHELNNPLSYLGTNIGALQELIAELAGSIAKAQHEEAMSMLSDCVDGVKRLVSIVQALKGSSRQGRPDAHAEFDPAAAVHSAVTLFRSVHKSRVSVDWQRSDLPEVRGSAGALSQVVLNLLQNALDAMGDGRLVVTARSEGARVLIDVVDEGPGIPADVQARLFEPFYTTKAEGTGTGLGLFLCRQMIESMGGELSFRTGPTGTTFQVTLPAAVENEAAVAA
jgi:PAS domain S-box-containing protein